MQIKDICEIMKIKDTRKIKDFQDAENLRFSCITGMTREEIEELLERKDIIEIDLSEP